MAPGSDAPARRIETTTLRPLHARGADIDRIDLVGAGDEEAVAPWSAEGDIGDGAAGLDAAEQGAGGIVDVHARSGTGPHIAFGVDAEAIREAVVDVGEDLAVLEVILT